MKKYESGFVLDLNDPEDRAIWRAFNGGDSFVSEPTPGVTARFGYEVLMNDQLWESRASYLESLKSNGTKDEIQ